MLRFTQLAGVVATFVLLAGVHSALKAQPDASLTDVSLPRLQKMVLSCDLRPHADQTMTSTQAFCAFAADELRRRAFAGSQERLLEWWHAEWGRREDGAAPATARPAKSAAMPATLPVAATAAAASPSPPSSQATPEQLKRLYLQCEHRAQNEVLDSATAATCSMVYEVLKQRVFAGEFDRLHAWWRQQKQAVSAHGTARAEK